MTPPPEDNPYLATLAVVLVLLIYVLSVYAGFGDMIKELLGL